MQFLKVLLATFLFAIGACAESQVIESGPFDWKDFGADVITPGRTTKLFEGSSDAFKYLYIGVTSVDAGRSFALPKDNEDLEALLIMKSGTLNQKINDDQKEMGSGSVSVLMPGEKVVVNNMSAEPATLYVLMWRAKDFDEEANPSSNNAPVSHLIDWNDVEYIESETRGRRNFIREPTVMMEQFEMHTTTLNEGITSHPPHTHIDEEVILVRYGEVEEHIDGGLHQVGAGSLIFLRSMVPHGIRNVGKGPAEYYAFRWVPKKK